VTTFFIGELLYGAGSTAIRRGHSSQAHPSRSLLVTVTGRAALDELAPRLEAMGPAPGLSRLVHAGRLDSSTHGVVEEEPAGRPLAGAALPLRPDVVAMVVRQIAQLLAGVHRSGVALGGLQPELIYARPAAGGPVVTGLAPRAAVLGRRAFAFPHVYTLPDEPWDRAADVFSLCALASHWLSGFHPYRGMRAAAQLAAISRGERRPPGGPAAWSELIRRGLSPHGAERPELAELVQAMEELGAAA
jgi:hypothetical protein